MKILYIFMPFWAVTTFAGSPHWSLQPIGNPEPPALDGVYEASHPIDRFINGRLKEANIEPAPEASREHLVRRLYFDVVGLPPTFKQVQDFLDDSRPDAYKNLVNRLLASKHYGERWGRYWLDVVRYADTKGYLTAGKDRKYPYSYTYRDWVVRALNEDLPYDQFLLRQLAADHLKDLPKSELAALGFLTVGSRFINRRQLQIDDQIDVVSRGLMGLSVACARCHDHFFDPVTMADYYALYGIFENSVEPKELPVIRQPADSPGYKKFLEGTAKRQADIDQFLQGKIDTLQSKDSIKAYLTLVYDGRKMPDDAFRTLADKRNLYYKVGLRWRTFLKLPNRHAVWKLWNTYMGNFPKEPGNVLAELPKHVKAGIPANHLGKSPQTSGEMIQFYTDFLHGAYHAKGEHVLNGMVGNPNFPQTFNLKNIGTYIHRADRNKLIKLQNHLSSYIANSPSAPPRAMVVEDRPNPRQQRIFLSGNENNRGDPVERRFLEALQHLSPNKFPPNQSGRLELARAIIHPDNPLTARVIANRVWMHHFTKPLVATPSDFGTQGELPTHPHLLDHLARYLIDHKWSLKALHRHILNSQTYRLTSLLPAPETDPANTLLGRQNRRRLDFEAQRDALLQVCGQLDSKVGGHPVDITKPPFPRRRTFYAKIDRSNLPNLFQSFDFPNPDIHAPQRAETTVPQQALFNMNSPFVLEMSNHLAKQANNNIPNLYRLAYARNPTDRELLSCQHFVKLSGFPQLAQILVMSNEFLFVD